MRYDIDSPLTAELLHEFPAAKALVSPRCGIVKRIAHVPLGPDEPRLFWVSATPSDTNDIFGLSALNRGNAISFFSARATAKALGESVERYCASSSIGHRLLLKAERDFSCESFTSLSEYALYSRSSSDLPFPCSMDSSLVQWVEGFDLVRNCQAWIPAAFVFIPYRRAHRDESVFDFQISSGLACGQTKSKAIFSGLMEVLERDCFMRSWRLLRFGQSLQCSDFLDDEAFCGAYNALSNSGYVVDFRHIGHWYSVPVVLAYAYSETDVLPFVCGCGAGGTMLGAMRSAVEELALGVIGVSRRKESESWFPMADFSNVDQLSLHGLAYAKDLRLAESARCFLSQRESSSIDVRLTGKCEEDWLFELVQMLAEGGRQVIVVDLTTEDIRSLGLHVFRVVVPGAVPLDQNARYQHDISPSLLDISRDFPVVINSLPHPFP